MIALALVARPTGGEGVKSGPIGLAVILVLCIAAYFLFKSMSKHLKKVRDNFPADPSEQPADEAPVEPHPEESPASSEDSAQPHEAPPRSDTAP